MTDFETSIRVRYAETDAMGVAHHSNYFVWLELVRVEWLRFLGLDYRQMEADGFALPVVEAHLQYKSPAFFDDYIKIILNPPVEKLHARFMLTYTLSRQELLIAKGYTVHAFINRQRQLIKPPAFFLERIG
ncbi:MAG: acyl-CoA thioesterase [Puniceicoccales bacterium]|jgi:acyl-CoA thioester hydrolase|nr:acyl-CoA thioesterase [Puniceicoccales bacterium]